MTTQGNPSRKPHLGDLMVLIAAVAAGVAAYRHTNGPRPTPSRMVANSVAFRTARDGIGYATPVLIACTLAGAGWRLRPPIPAREELAVMPGATAALASFGVLAFGYGWMAVQLAVGTHPGFVLDPAQVNHAVYPGWAVAGSWLTLAVGGRWRFRRTWSEVFGVGLGLAWLGLLLVWYASWALL